MERAGRIIESWIPTIYDNKREMGLKQHDDSHKVVTINTAEPLTLTSRVKIAHLSNATGNRAKVMVDAALQSTAVQRFAARQRLVGAVWTRVAPFSRESG